MTEENGKEKLEANIAARQQAAGTAIIFRCGFSVTSVLFLFLKVPI